MSENSSNHVATTQSARPAIVAAVVAAALFSVTLNGTFVYDDFDVFYLDPRLRQPGQWWRYWTESYNAGVDNLYRPLVSMTYAIQWCIHDVNESVAWAYHVVNVLLHAAVSAMVAELARRLAGIRAAWIAGILFATHPIHVEAVANIVGRAELMCAAGVVGALVLFCRPMTKLRALGITGCFLVALLSKEQGMLTPLLLLILAISRQSMRQHHSPLERIPAQRTANALLVICLTWSLAGYIVFREAILKFGWERNFLDWTINPLVLDDADRWRVPIVLIGRYLTLLIAPLKLFPDYGATVIGWRVDAADPYLWLGIVAIIAWIIGLIFALIRRNAVAVFALLGLALTYGVVSNLPVLIGTIFGERLMYLPSVFFVILAALLLTKLPDRALIIVMAIVMSLFSVRLFTYAQRWNDRLSFYEWAAREQPESVRMRIALTAEYAGRNRLDDAARVADEASQRWGEYWEVWIARADIAMRLGNFDAAEAYLMKAAAAPRSPVGRVARWMAMLEQRRASATQPARER